MSEPPVVTGAVSKPLPVACFHVEFGLFATRSIASIACSSVHVSGKAPSVFPLFGPWPVPGGSPSRICSLLESLILYFLSVSESPLAQTLNPYAFCASSIPSLKKADCPQQVRQFKLPNTIAEKEQRGFLRLLFFSPLYTFRQPLSNSFFPCFSLLLPVFRVVL